MADEKKEVFCPYPDWKMHAFAPARADYSACTYYRIQTPLWGLQRLGLLTGFVDRGTHHHDREEMNRQSIFALLTADIDLLYAHGPAQGTNVLEMIQKMKPGLVSGRVLYPPSTVYDIDDNLDYVHPFNTSYAHYGIRGPDGEKIFPNQPGDPPREIGTGTGKGDKVVLWRDGETVGEKGVIFDLGRNHRFVEGVHAFARKCDGFTVPSKYLGKYLHETHGYPEPYIYPNSIIPEDWISPNFAPREKEVRILWQGGSSHMSDWYALRPAIQFIAKKYPHVKFVLFGSIFNWIKDVIPKDQVETHEWVPYDAYRPTRACMDADINLCVLRDDDFSRSKSAIKFYEGSIQGRPEATLAPNMPPYNEEVFDGYTGLLYEPGPTPEAAAESFAANLQHLIEKPELRKTLGDNAKEWVLTNRHYLKTAPGLYDYYYDLRLRKMKEHPYNPAEDKLPELTRPIKKSRAKRKASKAKKR